MTEYHYLLGADDVKTASHAIKNAAEEMTRAAANIADAFFKHEQAMESWLTRFEEILGKKGDS